MEHRLILELLGYAASALIAVSMMMSSILRLRLLNLAGAIGFAIYGLCIGAYLDTAPGAPISDPASFRAKFNAGRVGDRRSVMPARAAAVSTCALPRPAGNYLRVFTRC